MEGKIKFPFVSVKFEISIRLERMGKHLFRHSAKRIVLKIKYSHYQQIDGVFVPGHGLLFSH